MGVNRELIIQTPGRGLHEITREIAGVVGDSGVGEGLCTVFIRHTSASLIIQENADPSAKRDLERWLDTFVPDGTAYEHTDEGPDDMPSHIRSVLTATSLGIPVLDGRLMLGTWQGVYLWEHRLAAHTRRVVVQVLG